MLDIEISATIPTLRNPRTDKSNMADHDENTRSGGDSGREDPDSNQSGGDAPKKKLRRRRPQGYFTDGHGDPLQNLIQWASTREPTRTGAGSIILDSFINTPPPGVAVKKDSNPPTSGPGTASGGGLADKRGPNELPIVAFSKGHTPAFRTASEKAMMEHRHQLGDLDSTFRRANDVNLTRRGDFPRMGSESVGSEHDSNRSFPVVDRESVSVKRSFTQESWPPRRHHPYDYAGPRDSDRPMTRRDPEYVKPGVDQYGESDLRYPNRDASMGVDPYMARRAPSDSEWSGRYGSRSGWNAPSGRVNPNMNDDRYYASDGYYSPEPRRPNGYSGYRGGGDGPIDYGRGRYERDNWSRDEPMHSDHEGGPIRSRHGWSGHDHGPMGGRQWPRLAGEFVGRYSDPEALRPRGYVDGVGGHSPMMDTKSACEYEGCMSHHRDGIHHHRGHHSSSGPLDLDDPAYFRMGRAPHQHAGPSPNPPDRRWGGRLRDGPDDGSPHRMLRNAKLQDAECRGMRMPPSSHANFWRGKMERDMMDIPRDRPRGHFSNGGDNHSMGAHGMDGRYRDGSGNQSPATTTLAEMAGIKQSPGPSPNRNAATDPTSHQNGAELAVSST